MSGQRWCGAKAEIACNRADVEDPKSAYTKRKDLDRLSGHRNERRSSPPEAPGHRGPVGVQLGDPSVVCAIVGFSSEAPFTRLLLSSPRICQNAPVSHHASLLQDQACAFPPVIPTTGSIMRCTFHVQAVVPSLYPVRLKGWERKPA